MTKKTANKQIDYAIYERMRWVLLANLKLNIIGVRIAGHQVQEQILQIAAPIGDKIEAHD